MLAQHRTACQYPSANSAKLWGSPVDVFLRVEKKLEPGSLAMSMQANEPSSAEVGACWQCWKDGQFVFVSLALGQS